MLTRLLSFCEQGGPLSALTEEEVRRLAGGAEEVRCAAGEMLMRAGEPGDRVYIVLEGRLEALAPLAEGESRVLTAIGPGGLVGEVELIVGGTRHVDIRAIEDSQLAALSRESFDRLLADSPETWRHVSELVLDRVYRSELLPHLNRLFGPIEGSATELLRELGDDVEFLLVEAGENLFRQGEPAEAAYIVISGSLRAAIDTPERGEQIINEVTRGEMVGEMALLTDDPRSATIYAVRDSHLARISRRGFERLIDRRPQTLLNLSRLIIERLKRRSVFDTAGSEHPTCIGLLPAGESSVPLAEVARELAEGLAAHGSVALLTSAGVDTALGQPGIALSSEVEPAHLRLAGYLHEKEETHRYLLYEADPGWSRWTERCARQADQVVLIADAEGSPERGEIENRLAAIWSSGRAPRRSLLLLHPRDLDRPTGTRRWLAERDVVSVYHLRRGHAGDLGRTVRILAGRAIGLVLGGGGARGFAHLGVLRGLEELGVPVDMIGGSSVGAPIAGLAAQGRSAAESLAAAEKAFSSLLDYTLPLASLLSGRRISDSIQSHTGSWDIEDFWLPFFCVTTNLTTARSMVHRRGDSARAIRASVSIPGILPPVAEKGELLVDGGVLNNLPVDLMREMNPFGTLIVVDVVSPQGPKAKSGFGLAISGWKLALERLLPLRKSTAIPAISSTILQSMVVGGSQLRKRVLDEGLADLYLNIHVRGVGLLEFEKVDQVARIGYEESIGRLRQWLESGGLEGR